MDPHAKALIAGITALLCVASLVGYTLKREYANGTPHPAIDNLNARIKAWWVIAAAFGVAAGMGSAGIIGLFAFASLVSLHEFKRHTAPRQNRSLLLDCGALLLLAAQYAFIWMQWRALFIFLLPGLLLLAGLIQVSRPQRAPPPPTAMLIWGLILCVYLIAHAPALLMLQIADYAGRNVYLVVFLVLVTQLGDVLQYIWGKLFGRHKIAPAISPQKTVQGTIGGIVSATLLGAGLAAITPFSAVQAAVIAFALATLGFLGGLALSAIKRRRGTKDWGRLIAGHGGMLDRLDSLVLSAPGLFYVVWIGWAT